MIFCDIINEIKKNEYITEISYHPSGKLANFNSFDEKILICLGNRLVISDVKQNFHIFDLLPHFSSSTSFRLMWVESSIIYDNSISGMISRISWAPECFGQLFVAGTTERNISVWFETRKGYNDACHLIRNQNMFEGELNVGRYANIHVVGDNSWRLLTTFSPFKGKISNIKFADKDHGLIFAACDSSGVLGVFKCINLANKVEWDLETIRVRKNDHILDLDTLNSEEYICSLDWIPYKISTWLGITVAINNHIYTFIKKSRFWTCIETIAVNNVGAIKDVSWSKLALFSDNYKFASLHKDNTLIIWSCMEPIKLNDLERKRTISQLKKFEMTGMIERIYWHPLGQILACIECNGHTKYFVNDDRHNLREVN
ncbi:WD40 protein [Cryptosporidium canis]|uniref:WD40 protein n=1 Tax=Cryptosporidium canis TaxID=195482 RepID=A0ABQ8P731_9CRYT|nr:WD40 protein [Cryptosporidium canis]